MKSAPAFNSNWTDYYMESSVDCLESTKKALKGGYYPLTFCSNTDVLETVQVYVTHKQLRDFGRFLLQMSKDITKEHAQ